MKWLSVDKYPAPPRHLHNIKMPVILLSNDGNKKRCHVAEYVSFPDSQKWKERWMWTGVTGSVGFNPDTGAKVVAWLNTDNPNEAEIFDGDMP